MLSRRTVAVTRQRVLVVNSRRALSTRASTILQALDIPANEELPGVYDGSWKGSGDVLESVCPTTGEVIAKVRSVSTRILLFSWACGALVDLGCPSSFKLQC